MASITGSPLLPPAPKTYRPLILLLALCLSGILALQAQKSWNSLFDGQSLEGWESHGGNAKYHIQQESIVGTALANSPNTFLCTKRSYADFIFECEVFLPNALNTGIMFRAQLRPEDDRIYGYQCEIDPSSRSWTGGIYDEARRKWLYPLSLNEKARSYFRMGEWNSIRIEALGDELRTYVNGQMASRMIDPTDAQGVFGLQVHSIGDPSQEGYTVHWRKLRIHTDSVAAYRWTPDPQVRELSFRQNQLSEYEIKHGWRLLWDGQTSKGWRAAKLDHFPQSGWTIHQGILTIQGGDGGESTGPGDIVTEEHFSDFEFEFEFMLSQGANSGVKYFVDPNLNRQTGSAIGCEYQILDDERHPDAKMGISGNRTLASLYDLIPAYNLDYGRPKQVNPPGEWNRGRIVSRDGEVEHWLNGEKVISYNRFSQSFAALVNGSKYKDWPQFGRWPAGAILLQDHGNTVHFRNLKIREF